MGILETLKRLFTSKQVRAGDDQMPIENATLDDRIEHLLRYSLPFDPAIIENAEIREAIRAIVADGIQIRQDNFPYGPGGRPPPPRVGLAAYSQKHAPLIYLIPVPNMHPMELPDTIFHEAIHCTAMPLGRHIRPPEDHASPEYELEEICVYAALPHFYSLLGIDELRIASRANSEKYKTMLADAMQRHSRETLQQWYAKGIEAAEYLHGVVKAGT